MTSHFLGRSGGNAVALVSGLFLAVSFSDGARTQDLSGLPAPSDLSGVSAATSGCVLAAQVDYQLVLSINEQIQSTDPSDLETLESLENALQATMNRFSSDVQQCNLISTRSISSGF